MLAAEKEKYQKVIDLIENLAIVPEVEIGYFIPGVLVDVEGGGEQSGGPFIQFTYTKDVNHPWIQRMPLKRNYLEKSPEDLVNFITFALERFIEEIDSLEYGAQ